MACLAHAQQRRPGWCASDLLGKTQARQGLQKAHECADLKCSRHICAKHGSAGQCAWLASAGPSHGRGLPGQQPRRRAGERETACCRRRMQRLSGQRPSRPSLERSRRSSSATATRLVADVLELVADVVLARQCLRLDT